jgi:sulfopyruvate decarboxylase TPP-binding subunit
MFSRSQRPDFGRLFIPLQMMANTGPTYKKDAAASLPVFRSARSLLVMLEIRGYTARDLTVDNEILDLGDSWVNCPRLDR